MMNDEPEDDRTVFSAGEPADGEREAEGPRAAGQGNPPQSVARAFDGLTRADDVHAVAPADELVGELVDLVAHPYLALAWQVVGDHRDP